jgi:hypothetical protein
MTPAVAPGWRKGTKSYCRLCAVTGFSALTTGRQAGLE